MRVVFRAWYRLVLHDYWHDVRGDGPFVVESAPDRFVLQAYVDDSSADEPSDDLTVVFRAYLFEDVSTEILGVLRGDLDVGDLLEASDDGLGPFPGTYANCIRDTAAKIATLSTQALDLVQWQSGIRGGAPGFAPREILWWATVTSGAATFDDLDWRQIPQGSFILRLPDLDVLNLQTDVGHRTSQLLADGVSAPLGRSLLREAWRSQESNPRSALVMAIAAAETAVKQCIAGIVPDAAWLVERLPSPPLDQLVGKYLPTLPSAAHGFERIPDAPRAWVSVLEKAVTRRNKTVHGRESSIQRDELDTLLRTVAELLEFLELHSGLAGADVPDA